MSPFLPEKIKFRIEQPSISILCWIISSMILRSESMTKKSFTSFVFNWRCRKISDNRKKLRFLIVPICFLLKPETNMPLWTGIFRQCGTISSNKSIEHCFCRRKTAVRHLRHFGWFSFCTRTINFVSLSRTRCKKRWLDAVQWTKKMVRRFVYSISYVMVFLDLL